MGLGNVLFLDEVMVHRLESRHIVFCKLDFFLDPLNRRTSHNAQCKQGNHIDEDAKVVQLGKDLYRTRVVSSSQVSFGGIHPAGAAKNPILNYESLQANRRGCLVWRQGF